MPVSPDNESSQQTNGSEPNFVEPKVARRHGSVFLDGVKLLSLLKQDSNLSVADICELVKSSEESDQIAS